MELKMNKKIILGLAFSCAALLSNVANAENTSSYSGDAYRITCTGTDSGNSWVRHTVGFMSAYNYASICRSEGGTADVRATNTHV